MLKAFKGTAFHDSLESLSQKIKATLPPESMKYLKSVEQTLQVGIKPYKDYARFREIINRLNEAALQKKIIEMVYYTMSRRKEGKRKVDPYRIWFFNGTFYMIGYCHQRRGIRIFAVDRIKMLHQTKESFEIPEDFDFEEFMRPSFGVFQGKGVKVRIWFAPDAAGYIKEKIWHDTQQIISQKDGSILFEADVAGTQEIKFWVMGWGSNALVLEPIELRNQILAESLAMVERYGKEHEGKRQASEI
jgi:predicted DNA-binding transcriptional regulator YafY